MIDNNVTLNHDGIRLLGGSDGIMAENTISDNTAYGIYLWGHNNYSYLNCLGGNGSENIHVDFGTGNVWHSRTKHSYFPLGPARKNYLGNYYDDHAGVDEDGDGIGDAPYVGATFTDEYPLMATRENYTLETWYLNDHEMYGNDLTGIPGDRTIGPEGTLVWVADYAAIMDETFLAGDTADQTCWTYQLFVEYGVESGAYLSIILGHANEDGSDFTSVGGNPSAGPLVQEGWYVVGTIENVQEFTVPAGRHLALQIENAHTYYSYNISGGGCWSYISASYPSPSYPVGFDVSTVGEPRTQSESSVLQLSATPNPFSLQVRLSYELSQAMPIALSIHDVTGRQVRTVFEGLQSAGRHAHVWNGRNDAGRPEESGLYYYRLNGFGDAAHQRIILVR